MTSKKYNQFIQHQMKASQPDTEKLIGIATFLRKEYSLTVHREAILMFDKNDGHLITFASWITKEQFHKYIIHVPDLLFFVGQKMWIMEIDGWIHNTKTSVVRKDITRNKCYKTAKLNYIIINEWDAMYDEGINPVGSARVKELLPEIKKRLSKILT